MLYFNCRVIVGAKLLDTCESFEITKSWRAIGDKATLRLPGLKQKLEGLVKTGDPVQIWAGYNGEYVKEFEGYVAEISPKIPFELRLEDESYWLKKSTVEPKSWKSISLKSLLEYVGCTELVSIPDVDLSPFRLEKVSKFKALEKIKEEFGLTIYFRGKKLFAGLAYTENVGGAAINYHLQKNVISADLTFKRSEDVKLKVNAVSILDNNTQIKASVGDDDGDEITQHFYNIKKESELKKLAQEALGKLKYEGYRGSITTFGQPYIEHGQTANLLDDLYPERKASVFVDEVTTTASKSGGFRRVLKLGRRAS